MLKKKFFRRRKFCLIKFCSARFSKRTNFLLVASYWLLVTSHQLLVTSYQSLVTSYQSLVTSHQLLVTSYQSLVTSNQSLVTSPSHQLLVTNPQLLVTSCQLIVIDHQLLLFTSYYQAVASEVTIYQLLQKICQMNSSDIKTFFQSTDFLNALAVTFMINF